MSMKLYRQLAHGKFEDRDFIAFWPGNDYYLGIELLHYDQVRGRSPLRKTVDQIICLLGLLVVTPCLFALPFIVTSERVTPPTGIAFINVAIYIVIFLFFAWLVVSFWRMYVAVRASKSAP